MNDTTIFYCPKCRAEGKTSETSVRSKHSSSEGYILTKHDVQTRKTKALFCDKHAKSSKPTEEAGGAERVKKSKESPKPVRKQKPSMFEVLLGGSSENIRRGKEKERKRDELEAGKRASKGKGKGKAHADAPDDVADAGNAK